MNEPYDGDYVIMGKDFVDTTDESNISKLDIPKHIVFTYSHLKLVPNKVFKKWKELNPDHKLIFFNDEDCKYFLEKKFNKEYSMHFDKIKQGAHKADFFRICFLYIYGGIYSDIDIEPYKPINIWIKPYNDIKFCTVLANNNKSCFQAIIFSTKKNIILYLNIKKFIEIMTLIKDQNNYHGAPVIGTTIMYNTIKKILIDNKVIKAWGDIMLEPHKNYLLNEKVDNKEFKNYILLLDEFTPDGKWWNCCVRSGYDLLCRSRYQDYPWFKNKLR